MRDQEIYDTNAFGGLPPEEYRHRFKLKKKPRLGLPKIAIALLMYALTIQTAGAGVSPNCETGYYKSGSQCVVCPKGSRCASGATSTTACTAGTEFSSYAQSACVAPPTGWRYVSTTSPPLACSAGQYVLYTASPQSWVCTACPTNTVTSTGGTSSIAGSSCSACTGVTFPSPDLTYCQKCTEGQSCATGLLGAACSSGQYSKFGVGSCANSGQGFFAPSTKLDRIAAPIGSLQPSTTTATTYTVVAANNRVTAATGQIAQTACGANSFTAPYAGANNACQSVRQGYSPSSLFQTQNFCPNGQYSTNSATACAQCPVNQACSVAAAKACPNFFYSVQNYGYCKQIGPSNEKTATGTRTCATAGSTLSLWSPSSNCAAPTNSIRTYVSTAINEPCPAGWWNKDKLNSCVQCTQANAEFCPNGLTNQAATNTASVVLRNGATGGIPCPPGYTCGTNTITLINLVDGASSKVGVSGSTTADYIFATDLSGASCPAFSFKELTKRQMCSLTTLDNGKSNGAATPQQTPCTGHTVSWWGTECASAANITSSSAQQGFVTNEDAMSYYNQIHCPAGQVLNGANTGSLDKYICSGIDQSWKDPSYWSDVEAVRGKEVRCETGQIVGSSNTVSITTMYTGVTTSATNSHKECRECTDSIMCHTGGSWINYCWGKQTWLRMYDDHYPFTGVKASNSVPTGNTIAYSTGPLMRMDDKRVAMHGNAVCFDCNAVEYSSGICSFASDYFPDHSFSKQNMVVKCPFQSLSRSVTRYLDTIGYQRKDSASTTYTLRTGSTMSYTTYAWFFDDEPNYYGWSYCNIDEDFYTPKRANSHQDVVEKGEITKQDCTIFEHLSVNYPDCHPNRPGFISIGDQDTPTETPIMSTTAGYFTQLAQYDDQTSVELKQCPQGMEPIMTEGGSSSYLSCRVKAMGSCNDPQTADYCNSGYDFDCPDGFYVDPSLTPSTRTNTINDCINCPQGQTCNGAATATAACPNGYYCEAGTVDVSSRPAQPGDNIPVGTTTSTGSACTGGYCSGASTGPTACPPGFQLSSGASGTGAHTQANCIPNAAGNYISSGSSATCPIGNYCPDGSNTAIIQAPPGYFAPTTGLGSFDSLTQCPAGSFCGLGSSASSTQCTAGFYCPTATKFQFEYACPAGTFAPAGGSSVTSCADCAGGKYCREGAFSDTDATLCAAEGYVCAAGGSQRTTCPAGQTTTDGINCVACAANKFCPPGVPETGCQVGYASTGSLGACVPSTPGKVVATVGTAEVNAPNGQWTLAGQVIPFACPAGSSCTGGVKTICPAGSVCPEGSAAPVAASAGTYKDQTGLGYQKKCAPGSMCGATTTTTPEGQYTLNGDDGSTPKYCNSGYHCPAGATGPNYEVCPVGQFYTSGATSGACITCASGSYCYQALQISCEPGFFCDITSPASSKGIHESCPVGTFAAGTGTVNKASCTPCTGGKACTQQAAVAATYSCAPGYFCWQGSTSTQPTRMTSVDDPLNSYQCDPNYQVDATKTCYQGICPYGYYCTGGTAQPTVCPAGTFAGGFGARSASDCTDCQQGYYCGNTTTSVKCAAGTYCPIKSVDESLKPATGQYSLAGYPAPIPCPYGTFQTTVGQGSCTICTAGKQCDTTGLSNVNNCAKGSDCSLAGTIVPKMCYYGQYLDPVNTVNPTCIACPEDMYCYNDAVIDTEIAAGDPFTTSSIAGACPNGYKCKTGATIAFMNIVWSAGANNYLCKTGQYCDNTQTVTENDCPAGTYMPRIGAQVLADCVPCKPGFQCPTTAGGVTTPLACTSGFYCPQGTDTTTNNCPAGSYCPANAEEAFACPWGMLSTALGNTACQNTPAGTFAPNSGLAASTTCTTGFFCVAGASIPWICGEGKVTLGAGTSPSDCLVPATTDTYVSTPSITGTLSDGYYSDTKGEFNPIPTAYGAVCPPGFFCAAGVKTQCVAGTYCDAYLMNANTLQCSAGYYCLAGATSVRPLSSVYNGGICPVGYFCPIGTSAPQKCAIGSYSDAYGYQAQTECHPCSNGYFCPTTGGQYATMLTTPCPAGTWCGPGITASNLATVCDAGYECPVGSVMQIPCKPGRYNANIGTTQSSCTTCETGNFCKFWYALPAGQASQKLTCPIGQYCANTGIDSGVPTGAGYYQDQTGQTTQKLCPAGFYCPLGGMSVPIPCPDQFICIAGSAQPTICSDGYVCEDSVANSKVVATLCPTGYFCKAGLKFQCWAGYICKLGSTTPTPTDGAKGYICPSGYYCAAGALIETACAAQFYNPYQGATDISFCQACPPGTSCPNQGTSYPTPVTCPEGYICPAGSQVPCVAGMYCPLGTTVMIPCLEGTYQDQTAKSTCKPCPAGKQCLYVLDGAGAVLTGTVTPTDCPEGFFCEQGTGQLATSGCPLGTFGATTGLTGQGSCTKCDATYYCPEVGMKQSVNYHNYVCTDGYICDQGSLSSTGSYACPIDKWCVAGVPTTCPQGQYAKEIGSVAVTECVDCPPGKTCPSNSQGILACPAGNYCTGKNYDVSAPSATFITCPAGSYCPSGSAIHLLCKPGYYQDTTGQTSCKICPAGSYCPTSGLTAPVSCATSFANYYCPIGSIKPSKCPIGTYVVNQQTCTACPAGKYCYPADDNTHDGIVNDCDYANGYLCRSGAFSPKPMVAGIQFIQAGSQTFLSYNGPVLQGYTAADLGVAVPCPAGTFASGFYNSVCITCYPGYFCPNQAMVSIVGYRCSSGYYCLGGNQQQSPLLETDSATPPAIIGDICPIGKYCSYNLIHQMDCPDGFHSGVTGLARCNSCPMGKFCDEVASKPPVDCIPGSFCSGGVKRQPLCPSGTYYNQTNQNCTICTATNYCRANLVADKCAAGYLCPKDDYTIQPNPPGKECEAGYYCPRGNYWKIYCPFETQSVITAARQVDECTGCQPGFLCPAGYHTAYECPMGHYCPPIGDGMLYPQRKYECEVGTWNPQTKQLYQHNCYDCTAGHYCNMTALTNLTGLECPKGYYCPERTVQPVPCPAGTFMDQIAAFEEDMCEQCPLGFYCPIGSAKPTRCDDGFYCPLRAAAPLTCPGGYYCNLDTRHQPIICPINTYCPRGSKNPQPCDLKHVCDVGTETQVFCPNGFFVQKNAQYGGKNLCLACDAGFYSIQTTVGCAPCPPGYLCYGKTNSDKPKTVEANGGEICPKGHYCPLGSSEPVMCPPGSFNPNTGGKSADDCILCPAGTSNSAYGSAGCQPCGQFASSIEGSQVCTCIGKNRAYSTKDASCRCKTGFDFYSTQGVSQGQSSATADCIPIVYSICKQGEVRSPTGACLPASDCSKECAPGNGTRDAISGVCRCAAALNTDQICNQNCRNNVPIPSLSSTGAQLSLATPSGQTLKLNLSSVGDVFGAPAENNTGVVKTVSMTSNSFEASYSPPPLLTTNTNKSSTTQLSTQIKPSNVTSLLSKGARNLGYYNQDSWSEDIYFDDERNLQAVSNQAGVFSNPLYCVSQGDTFLFTITDPTHYPVYMKDSVMNNNPTFDYGSFLDLATEMQRKTASGDRTPSIFSFTFTHAGNYVFHDAASDANLMIVSVKGPGLSCPSKDAYLQVISGETLANLGIAQNKNLILKPNYPLYGSMLGLLILSTIFIMWMVHYCMTKGWFIQEPSSRNYRSVQLSLDIGHENKEVFNQNNDFVQNKSELIDSDEDDLDNLNFEIQQDIVEAGEKYVHMYEKRKQKIKANKQVKKNEIFGLLNEIEDLVNMLNSDATAANMHWVDLDTLGDGTTIDDDKIKKQIEKQLNHFNKTEEQQNELQQKKREEMLQDASELERAQYERAKAQMNKSSSFFKDQLEIDNLPQVGVEYAIYDNGNVKSENNKFVFKVAQNELLNDEEREQLLKAHEAGLHNITNVLENEKKRQEQELDRALQERLARRHRLKEQQHKLDIKADLKQEEKEIIDQIEVQKKSEIDRLDKEHEKQIKDILSSNDITQQRSQIQTLEELTEQKKRQVSEDLEAEKEARIEAKRAEVYKKYNEGVQSEEQLQNQLKQLLGDDASQLDRLLRSAEIEKAQQEQKLKDRLAQKQAKIQQKVVFDAKQQSQAIEKEDVIQAHEREVVSMEAQIKLKEKNAFSDAKKEDGSLGIDKNGLPVTDASQLKAADVARKEEEERKAELKEMKFKLLKEIDTTLEKSSLMAELEEKDATLAIALKNQTDAQHAKLEARKAHLRARKLAKSKAEAEEIIVKQKVELVEEEQQAKREITEEYIRKVFKEVPKNETPQQRDKRLELLNEYLSEQFLEQLSELLNKQFLEKDGFLKLCLNKYMEESITEVNAIKSHFKIDMYALQKLKDKMPEGSYNEQVKRLRLNEENLLRETALRINKAQAEEEARIRKELDKKHCQEQVEFRSQNAQRQAQLRMQLIGESNLANTEYELERKALEKYEQMKHTEQERRLRNAELQKKTITNQIDSELKNAYENYDDMIRKKKQAQKDVDEQALSILKRMQERKEKLRKANVVEGMSKEEQEAMLKNYQEQLSQLDSAYSAEQRRQQLIMKTKQENRKKRLIKVQQLKNAIEKQPVSNVPTQNKLTQGLRGMFKRSLVQSVEFVDENSELVKRMKAWRQAKKNYELKQFMSKINQAINTEQTAIVQGLVQSSPDFRAK